MKNSKSSLNQKRINELKKNIETINYILKTLNIPENILNKEIKPFGNASHIILPKSYTNKKAKVIIDK